MKRFFSIIILLTIFSCQNKMKTLEGDFTIHAMVEGLDTVIFEKIEANNLILIDTLFAIDGEFVTTNSLDQSSFFLLRTPEGEGINLLITKGEKIKIQGKKLNWHENYTIDGSPGSSQIQELNDTLIKFKKEVDLIYQEALDTKKENYINIQNRFNGIFNKHQNFLKTFIDSNLESKISILALFQAMKGENILNLYTDFDYYKKVHDTFQNKWPSTSHAKLLADLILSAYAPDFTMENIYGDTLSLRDYKGKLTLLYFWASWSSSSRDNNQNMIDLYNKFHLKGLEIIGISLDGISQQKNPKEDWKKAVREDKMIWPQISQLNGLQSSIREKYKFRTIPYNVLIDSDGHIIFNSEDYNSLQAKITEILSR